MAPGSAYQRRPNGSASENQINAPTVFARADFVGVHRSITASLFALEHVNLLS